MQSLKKIAILVLTLFFLHNVQAQDSSSVSKIYFVRSTGYNGSLLTLHCFIDSNMVCGLKNNQYSVHSVPPGTYRLNVTAHAKKLNNDKKSLTIATKAGQSYYIKIMPVEGYDNKVKIISLSENTIRPLLAKCELNTQCLNQ